MFLSVVYSDVLISTLLCVFCRLVCLRVHPTFSVLHPSESFVSFTSMDGSKHEVFPDGMEQFFEGDLIPNGNVRFIFFLSCYYPHEMWELYWDE